MQRLARRRKCPKCDYAYGTVEMPESEYAQLMTLKEMVRKLLLEDNHEDLTDQVNLPVHGSETT